MSRNSGMWDMQVCLVPSNPKSAIRNPKFAVEWDPRLVEEAVLCVVQARGVHGFRGERNRLYEIQDPEEREAAFRNFHAAWFERLDLGRGAWGAIYEQPLILTRTRTCVVAFARAGRDEGGELFVSPAGEGAGEAERRSVTIRLVPQRLLNAKVLLGFLRHELLHIADMLDPSFAYEPGLPQANVGPAHQRLLQDRYRVLWDTYIDGRLTRLGRIPESVREFRLQEFSRAFPMLGEQTAESFHCFFEARSCTHADLVAFATNPVTLPIGASDSRFSNPKSEIRNPKLATGPRPHAGQRCPLCGFPTYAFQLEPDRLLPDVLHRIHGDFPGWNPSQGLCQQCADLYSSLSPLGSGLRPPD